MEKKFEAMAVADKKSGPIEPFFLERNLIVTKPMAWETEATNSSPDTAEEPLMKESQGIKSDNTTRKPAVANKPMSRSQAYNNKELNWNKQHSRVVPVDFEKPTVNKPYTARAKRTIASKIDKPFPGNSRATAKVLSLASKLLPAIDDSEPSIWRARTYWYYAIW